MCDNVSLFLFFFQFHMSRVSISLPYGDICYLNVVVVVNDNKRDKRGIKWEGKETDVKERDPSVCCNGEEIDISSAYRTVEEPYKVTEVFSS